jgi:hypothetical protein
MYVNGTVSRGFSSPVFFIKQLLLVQIGMPRNDFKFFRLFMELFVFGDEYKIPQFRQFLQT